MCPGPVCVIGVRGQRARKSLRNLRWVTTGRRGKGDEEEGGGVESGEEAKKRKVTFEKLFKHENVGEGSGNLVKR